MKSIQLDSVSKHYDSTPALNQVSLEIEAGERIAILGPSGCGKTTLLRLVAGFISPDAGCVALGGGEVACAGRIVVPPEGRNLGMVFQDLALWPHLDVKGNLEFGLKARKVPPEERKARIGKMLERVGLTGLSDRKPAELSGGQQQRVALARALVPEPGLLLMDEPFSSLDPALKIRLREEVVRLQETLGFTLLHVTHDRTEAADIATRIISMRQGRVE